MMYNWQYKILFSIIHLIFGSVAFFTLVNFILPSTFIVFWHTKYGKIWKIFQIRKNDDDFSPPELVGPVKLRDYVEKTMDISSASPRRFFFEVMWK